MFLQRIEIKRFRGIHDLSLDFDDLTVLIGSNNTGKTTILDALQICLSRSLSRRAGAFSDFDHRLPNADTQPQDAEPIEITLSFLERDEGEWPEELAQTLNDAIGLTGDGKQAVILRVTSGYNPDAGDFQTSWTFLDPAGNPMGAKATNLRYLNDLQRIAPVFYLSALRDASQQFRAQSPFWGPFVRSLNLDQAEREEIEDALAELNQRVLDSHDAFRPVLERLRKTARLVPLGGDDPVSIEALPARVFDMLSRTQVLLTGKSGAQLPISRHGEGTQSAAVICLFDAFLEAKLSEGYTPHTEPILALEEPEAHLHPSAVRGVANLLKNLRGQKIIATHSGDLLSAVPITAVRRLSRVDGQIKVHRVNPGSLTADEIQKLDHHVRLSRGSLLFAQFWLLVEGETEVFLFQECARIMDIDLFSAGISCVEYTRVGVEVLVKMADQFGIDWLVLADKDRAGDNHIRSATRQLGDRPSDQHLRQLPSVIEAYLCSEGFGDIYEANISNQKRGIITADTGTAEYWDQVVRAQSDRRTKPELASEVISRIEDTGDEAVPSLIHNVIINSTTRAEVAE